MTLPAINRNQGVEVFSNITYEINVPATSQPQPPATACLISHRVAPGGCRKLSNVTLGESGTEGLEQLRKGPLAGIHINGRLPTDRPLEATSDIDLAEPVVHIGGQFSVTTRALDTNLHNGLLDTNGVSNFALAGIAVDGKHCHPMHFTTQLKGMPWLTMVNLVNLHLRQVLTTPGANLWDGAHFFGDSNFNLACTTTQFEDSGSQLQVGATHSLFNFNGGQCWNVCTSTTEFKIDGFNGFDPTYDALMFNPHTS
ncbi:hypothetical protein K438DRAFT_1781288 [Mycena galopus ATCC 62051]|nr:hypothetical protein K438DRAFT_1781288 [Mycena galopus ATCC 62051]